MSPDPRNQLFSQFQDCLAAKRTGTLFVITRQNRALSIGLLDGWIVYACGARLHGQAVITLLAEAQLNSFSFKDGEDYPFRPRDEIVHVDAMTLLQPLMDRARQALNLQPTAAQTEPEEKSIGVGTRIYRGQVISD